MLVVDSLEADYCWFLSSPVGARQKNTEAKIVDSLETTEVRMKEGQPF